MPNDTTGQFPLPESKTVPEVKLTDEVAPDLTAPGFTQPASTPPQPQTATTPTPPAPTAPSLPPEAPLPPAPIPASPTTFAGGGGTSPITILLLIISIAAIAATYFFYQQSRSLTTQVNEISKTLQQQQTQQNQATTTPTPSTTPALTISPTPAASTTATPSPLAVPGSIFSNIKDVMAAATKQYPDAQLLMVIATSVEDPNAMIVKYWFRQNATDKKYLYVLRQPGQDLSVVDQQVYVTPDNNIPSLNQLAQTNKLGIDLPDAVTIAAAKCPINMDCSILPISAQFIKTTVPIWQITYKPSNGSKPFVVQIDSSTQKILYKSL